MIVSKPGDRGDSVDERHVQVDHDGVRIEVVRLLDRLETVFGKADDAEIGLPIDQLSKRVEERPVVVGEEDADSLALLS